MKRWLLAEVITDIPRWFFLLAWLTFYIATGAAMGLEFYAYPARPVIINIKQGLAFAGGGLYPWLLAALYLHLEVAHMILSRRANRLEVERESKRAAAAAAEQASKQAAEQTAQAERAKVLEWYEQHKDRWPEDLPLPPGVARNYPDNGAGNGNK